MQVKKAEGGWMRQTRTLPQRQAGAAQLPALPTQPRGAHNRPSDARLLFLRKKQRTQALSAPTDALAAS